MKSKVISFIGAALTALSLALVPAQGAAAWDKACLDMPFTSALTGWFSTTIHVVHGYNPEAGVPSEGGNPQDAALFSSEEIAVNDDGCVSVKEIPNGEPFYVYLETSSGATALCTTHAGKSFYTQRPGSKRFRELRHEAGGTLWDPTCKFAYER